MEDAAKKTGQAQRIVRGALVACAMLLAPLPALAQRSVLVDPMRPADTRAASPAAAAAAAPASGAPQVILISPQRKLAVIDGAVVPIGASARAGTLVGLTDSAAVLSKEAGQDVLLMHPNVHKKPPSRSAP